MKKLASIFVALLLVAVSVVSAFAADINANEKKVLDELKTSVKMQGKDMYLPDSFVNQAENYFNTIDMTAEQADEFIAVIKSGKTQLEATGAKNIADCTTEQKKELFTTLGKVMAPVGGTATHVKDEITLKIEKDVKEFLELAKRIKKIQDKFEKLGKDAKEQFDEHRKALKLCSEVIGEEGNVFDQCAKLFEEADALAAAYEQKLASEVIPPVKKYLEILASMEKRTKILDDRRRAYDRAYDNYYNMLKKPADKQVGLQDLKVNFQNTRDSYEYLRDELAVDCNNVGKEIKENFGQICQAFMKNYSAYMKDTEAVWNKIESFAEGVQVGDLDKSITYTPTEQSMVGEPNVQAKRQALIDEGKYKPVE